MTILADLISQTRLLSSMEVSQFVTDAEITVYLNWGLSALDDLLVGSFEDYKLTSIDLNLGSVPSDGYNYITLPVDFLKSRKVQWQRSSYWLTLERDGMQSRDDGANLVDQMWSNDKSYRIQADKLWLNPWQSAPGKYRLHYIQRFVPLADGYDQLADYMDQQQWCQYAVIFAVVKIVTKQEMDASQWQGQLNELYSRIQNAAKPRDAGPPKSSVSFNRRRGMRGGYNGF